MINLQQLTKQKFERMGFNHSPISNCWLYRYEDETTNHIPDNLAQLITLDGEIEKLEARKDEIERCDGAYFRFLVREAETDSEEESEWIDRDKRIEELEQQLAELKNLREELK